MNSKVIKLNAITDIKNFIEHAALVDGDVLVKRGKYVVAGTSILGMMSIDTAQGCTVEYPEGNPEFDMFLNQFVM